MAQVIVDEVIVDEVIIDFYVQVTDQVSNDPVDEVYYHMSRRWAGDVPGVLQGWIPCHTSVVLVKRPSPEELVPEQVRALEEEIDRVQAVAGSKVNSLQEAISKLLAIGGPT